MDTPISPRRIADSQFKYLSVGGAFSPQYSEIASRCSMLTAPAPITYCCTGSIGERLASTNATTDVARSRVRTRKRYLPMALLILISLFLFISISNHVNSVPGSSLHRVHEAAGLQYPGHLQHSIYAGYLQATPRGILP